MIFTHKKGKSLPEFIVLFLTDTRLQQYKPALVLGYVAEKGYAKYWEVMRGLILDKEREIYSCKLCIADDTVEEDQDKHKILDHIETHHVKSAYECGECGIILPTRAMINTHKLKRHRDAILSDSKNIAEIHQLPHVQQSGTPILPLSNKYL